MRAWILTALVFLAACSREEQKPPSEPASNTISTAAPRAIDPLAIIGTWSFDRSCASGDGMTLHVDGSASYDEWGAGTWRVDEMGSLVLDLVEQEMGVLSPSDPPRRTITIVASEPVTDQLVATIQPDGRAIDALRCP